MPLHRSFSIVCRITPFWALLWVLLPFSCAREVEESTRSVEERILAAHLHEKYLDTLHKTAEGAYYMIQAKGNGTPVTSEDFVFVRYSVLDYNYNYSQTSEEHVAKQLGYYSKANYYGPKLKQTDVFFGSNDLLWVQGIDDMILTMREGDRRRVVLPSWLSAYKYGGSPSYSNITIHDVEILRVVPDIEKFQIDSLESYRNKYYLGVDSLSYGFYKKALKAGVGDTLKQGNRLKVWYVGRLLDDFVFDTNIADTAKKYDIFDKTRAYEALEGELKGDKKEDERFSISGSENDDDTVKGFSKTLFTMKDGEEAVCFFYAALGYKDGSGLPQGSQIPAYAPLVFFLKVERVDVVEEEDQEKEEGGK